LPNTGSDTIQWRWVPGSEWRVDPSWTDDALGPASSASPAGDGKIAATSTTAGSTGSSEGWIYYDNKWRGGSKTDDSWTKWTRRRRWIRDAALVEVVPTLDPANPDQSPSTTTTLPSASPTTPTATGRELRSNSNASTRGRASSTATAKKGWFGGARNANSNSNSSAKARSFVDGNSTDEEKAKRARLEEDVHTPLRYREEGIDRSIGDGLAEGLS
jgi:hypothetical protein